ncbi:hypothetical protein ACFOSC_27850 [Streptantibioticus rubrisoli]|uniref:Uncharacterized protein n=1 Tax=Streptantibioticus rubrisoli TaxID=1387313 RepID=A0ABT1PKD6_9ACTN|nr:hypothetical protein [Streptantibioticus rubrisoli]MCQ4045834.1 hypothetical protein [Streptantibioticus rubrisoli]
MGRFKANKPRRERGRLHIDNQPVDEAAIFAEANRMAEHVDDHGRIMFWDDPALQLGELATGVDVTTGAITTAPGESGQMPAALFEPERAMMTRLPGQPPKEGQVEGTIALGFRRFPRGFADIRTAPGWELHRLPDDQLELRPPHGGVYSRIRVPLDPAWVSAALHHGHVLCLYGPQLGVRTPPGTPAAKYTPQARLEEFRQGRERGWVAGGLVTYFNNR